MSKTFVITTERQKQKFLAALRLHVAKEQEDVRRELGRKLFANMATEEPIPPERLRTLHTNAEVRETVYNSLIGYMEGKTRLPITLEDYHNQLMMTFATSGIPKDYTDLCIGLIPSAKAPELAQEVTRNMPKNMSSRGFLPAKAGQYTQEDLRCMELRSMTIDRIMHIAFDTFYLATAHGQEINSKAKDYKEFVKQTEQLLGHVGGRAGSK